MWGLGRLHVFFTLPQSKPFGDARGEYEWQKRMKTETNDIACCMHNMTYGTMYEPIPHEQVYLVGIGLCSQTQTVFAETISIFQKHHII
jgi:hypothetical protein